MDAKYFVKCIQVWAEKVLKKVQNLREAKIHFNFSKLRTAEKILLRFVGYSGKLSRTQCGI